MSKKKPQASKQGRRARRRRRAADEKRLRRRVQSMTLEVSTGRVLDEALRRLCKSDKYPDLAADLDTEIERIVNEQDIKEISGDQGKDPPQVEEGLYAKSILTR